MPMVRESNHVLLIGRHCSRFVAESFGEFHRRCLDKRGEFMFDPLKGEPREGAVQTDAGQHLSGIVSHGSGNTPYPWLILFIINSEPEPGYLAEVVPEYLRVSNRILSQLPHRLVLKNAVQPVGRLVGQLRLSCGSAVNRETSSRKRCDPNHLSSVLDENVDDLRSVQNGKIGCFIALIHQLFDDRPGLAPKAQMMEKDVGDLERLDPQAVVSCLFVLLDIAPNLKGGQKSEDVVFG